MVLVRLAPLSSEMEDLRPPSLGPTTQPATTFDVTLLP